LDWSETPLVYDVHDPADIFLLGSFAIDAVAVRVQDSVAYVVEDRVGIHALDISDPGSITSLGSLIPEQFTSNPNNYSLEFANGHLFATGPESGLMEIDISDPGSMSVITQGQGIIDGFDIVADFAYVTAGSGGLSVLDIGSAGQQKHIGHYIVPDGAVDVDVVGDLAYIVDGVDGGLHIVNITDLCGMCSADLNGDGVLNFFDVSAFLAAFAGDESVGDFNGDGRFDFFDISAFLAAFNSGCP